MDIQLPSKAKKQTINGTVYVYLDKPFWNPQRKRGEHKREYIGKMEGNQFIPNKVYQKQLEMEDVLRKRGSEEKATNTPLSGALSTADAAADTKSLTSRQDSQLCSPLYILGQLSDRYYIRKTLDSLFPGRGQTLLRLAEYLALEGAVSFDYYPSWVILHSLPEDLTRPGQETDPAALLQMISEQDARTYFQKFCSFLYTNHTDLGQADVSERTVDRLIDDRPSVNGTTADGLSADKLTAYELTLSQGQNESAPASSTAAGLFSSRFIVVLDNQLGIPVWLQSCPDGSPLPVPQTVPLFPLPFSETAPDPAFPHKKVINRIVGMIHKTRYYHLYSPSPASSEESWAFFLISFAAQQLIDLFEFYSELFLSIPYEKVISSLYLADRAKKEGIFPRDPLSKRSDSFIRFIELACSQSFVDQTTDPC